MLSRSSIPRDVQEFLDRYRNPKLEDQDEVQYSRNWEFYSEAVVGVGKGQKETRKCVPNNLTISELQTKWMGSYDILEREHGYIQWLFPIREQGVNFQSQPLYPHEIQKMKHSAEVQRRFIQSYQLMLDFYGMKLASEDTGKLERSSNDPSHASYYVPRYQNLLRRSHNNLRITRILKSLSEMGLERFNAGFLLHVLSEQSDPDLRELQSHRLYSSMDGWWANCMRDNADREWVLKTIEKVRSGKIMFTRAMYESALERRRLTGSFAEK